MFQGKTKNIRDNLWHDPIENYWYGKKHERLQFWLIDIPATSLKLKSLDCNLKSDEPQFRCHPISLKARAA